MPMRDHMASPGEPQRIRFSPRFLHNFSAWLHTLPQPLSSETLGLLFGATLSSESVVQSFHVLQLPASTDHSMQRWQAAFDCWQDKASSAQEYTWLDLLGWFVLRPQSAGDLLPSDVAFHNTRFSSQNKVAVILRHIDETWLAADLYCSLPNSPLHIENHRRVSLRLSIDPHSTAPIIRPQIHDEAFLRAYQIAASLDRAERWQEWGLRWQDFKDRVRYLTHFDWLRR